MGPHGTYSRGFWLTDDDEELNRSKEDETEIEKGISTNRNGVRGGWVNNFLLHTHMATLKFTDQC